jgi:hypothetical protein
MSREALLTHPEICWDNTRWTPEQLVLLHQEANRVNAASLPTRDPLPSDALPFRFNALPREIQGRIFLLVFRKPGPVHCLSRLDKWNCPESVPAACFGRKFKLPHRFSFGDEEAVSVTTAYLPSQILAPLLVCKRWLYIGAAAFYGTNTFSFSSLGEFGAFMSGIGTRRQRICHVELL